MFRTRYLTGFIFSLLGSVTMLGQCPNFSNPPFETLGIGSSTIPGAMLFLPNGCLVSNNNDSITYYAFDPNTCSYPTTPQEIGFGTPGTTFSSLAFVPSCNNLLLAIDAHNNTVQQYRVNGCTLIDLNTPITVLVGTGEHLRSIAASPNGSCVAVLSNMYLYLYPISSSSCQIPSASTPDSRALDLAKFSNGNVAFITDGCLFATTGHEFLISATISTNCTFSGSLAYNAISGATSLTTIAVSPTGNCFAVGDDITPNCPIYTSSISSCCMPPNCSPASASFSSVTLPSGSPNSLAFSADGTCLAVSTSSGNVYLYTVAASCSLQTPPQNLSVSSAVQAALYSTSTCNILAVGQTGSGETEKKTQSKNNPPTQLKKAQEAKIKGAKEAQNGKLAQVQSDILIYQVVTAVPHLTITKECSKKVHKKDCITYEITVANTGTGASQAGAVVTDVLPKCVSFVEASGVQNYEVHHETFTATLPAIEPGASVVITITAKVHAHHKKEVTNSASLTYQGQTTESNECTTCIRR